jgi:CHAD domain-containing protein
MAKLSETKAPSRVTAAAARSDRRKPDSGAVVKASDAALGSVRREGAAATRPSALLELDHVEVWSRVQKLALQQLHRVVALEPKVLRGESPKPVHDLRVASRRVQSLLDFLYASPRPAQIQKLRRRLQRARRVLGDLRNHDVMADRIGRMLARKRATHREAWQGVHDYVLNSRPKIATRAYHKLTRLNLADVYLRLRQELADDGNFAAVAPRVITFPDQAATGDASLAPAVPQSTKGPEIQRTPPERFAERLGELWRDFEGLSTDSQRETGGLHALRVAAKRLRYTIEVAADLEIPGSGEAVEWLRELQGKLGDWHDAEVLGQTMIGMVARRKFLEQHLALAIEIEKLVLRLRDSKARSCKAYLRGTLGSAEYRRTEEWIAQWVSARARSSPSQSYPQC